MQGLSVRIKYHPPSCRAEAMAPVDVFSIHEEPLIEPADLPERQTWNHPEPACQHLDVINCFVGIALHFEAAKQLRPGEDVVKPQRTTKGVPDRGQAHHGGANSATRTEHLWPEHSYVRISFHELDNFLEAPRTYDYVGINQAHVFATAFGQSDVVRSGEAEIRFVLDQLHSWELQADR